MQALSFGMNLSRGTHEKLSYVAFEEGTPRGVDNAMRNDICDEDKFNHAVNKVHEWTG